MSTPRRLIDLTDADLEAMVEGVVLRVLAEHRSDGGPRLLDRAGAARLLAVSTRTLDRLVGEGLPHLVIGDSKRFEADAVIGWLRGRSQGLRLVSGAAK